MLEIKIEINEQQKTANYKISKNGRIEHEVKGLPYKSNNELWEWVARSFEQYLSSENQNTAIEWGHAIYAGYYEVAQAIRRIPVGQPFTTRDVAKIIVDERSNKFPQTHANISADFSAFNKAGWYPNWLEVTGQRGRARVYKKKKDISANQIEEDLKEAAKRAWNY